LTPVPVIFGMRPMILVPSRKSHWNGLCVKPVFWLRVSRNSRRQARVTDARLDGVGQRQEVDQLRGGDEHVLALALEGV
jgi:hypothetical protein